MHGCYSNGTLSQLLETRYTKTGGIFKVMVSNVNVKQYFLKKNFSDMGYS